MASKLQCTPQRRSACSRPMIAAIAPTPTGTAALHGIAANAQQPRRIGERKSAGGTKRRVFAERMTGNIGNPTLQIEAARLENAHDGDRYGHQSRLRIRSQRQLVFGAVEDDVRKLFTERLHQTSSKTARASAKFVGEILAHAERSGYPGREHVKATVHYIRLPSGSFRFPMTLFAVGVNSTDPAVTAFCICEKSRFSSCACSFPA